MSDLYFYPLICSGLLFTVICIAIYNLVAIQSKRFEHLNPKIHRALQRIRKNSSTLVADQANRVLNDGKVKIRSLQSMGSREYYQKVQSSMALTKNKPSYQKFMSSTLGLFMPPDQILVDHDQESEEVERTIVHEIKHYQNHNGNVCIRSRASSDRNSGGCSSDEWDEEHDELLARQAEDEYSGHYITRHYLRKLREKLRHIIDGSDCDSDRVQ